MPDAAAAHPVKVAGRDPVQGDRDQPDVVLGEHAGKEPAEIVPLHRRRAQNRGALLQGAHDQIPELAVLRGELRLSGGLQGFRPRRQLLRQTPVGQQRAESSGLPLGRMGQGGALGKAQERFGKAAAQGVDLSQALLGALVKDRAITVGMLPPVARALPGPAAQLPFIDVVDELVALLRVQTREPGAQGADHIVHLPGPLQDLIGLGDERRQRLGQQRAAAGGEEGHPVVAEHALQRAAIVLEAAHGHGDLPPAAALFPHQAQDLRRRGLALGAAALRQHQLHRGLPALPAGGAVAEHLLREPVESRVLVPLRLQIAHVRLEPQLSRLGHQAPRRDAGEGEKLVVAVQIVHREADREIHTFAQQSLQHGLLLMGKVDKAVHIDAACLIQIALRDLLGQHAQTVRRVGPTVGHHRVVGRADQRQIVELIAQAVVHQLGGLLQPLGGDAGAFQLVQRPQQHGLQLHLSRRRGIDPQAGAYLMEGQGHAQKSPALIQALGRAAAQAAGQAPGQARKAEHLAIEGEAVPADGAELPLRLVAVLLRHQQDLAAPLFLHRAADLRHDGGGLARAGLAQQQMQHADPSFSSYEFIG